MATIFFSMSGEGRGHATRVRALVEQLRAEHRLFLFAPNDAYHFLAPLYAGVANVEVVRIPGLAFHYNDKGRLAYRATIRGAWQYAWGLKKLVRHLEGYIREHRPDVVVTDFEPALPRAAKRCGVPFLSVNHQHFLIVNDLSGLPWHLRLHTIYMSWVVRMYYSGQAETVVSQFYFPPVVPAWQGRVVQAGVLLRPEILAAKPAHGEFALCYLRRFGSPRVMAALRGCGVPVRIYGLGEKPADGNLTYHAIHDQRFVEDLAACRALISTAGNQLVGEALFLGKPVFAMPEPNNHEQYINAHYLADSGAGTWVEFDAVTPDHLREFLGKVETYRARIDRGRMNGNPQALGAIGRYLGATPQLDNQSQPARTTLGKLAHQ